MSLIHRCDKCRKIVWSDDVLTRINGINYEFAGKDVASNKVKDQIININISFTAQCGQIDLELCDKCASKMLKHYTRNYGKK